ncbi:MAG TPA: FAD-dependent oxidoreductase [Lacunisphaera sp.]|nr:FAD-dependent oxidoreductase [Lacunisphaera sp.]
MTEQNDVDVVIIGAGFAGLSAADRIKQLNQVRAARGQGALSYVILEGSMRAGGRAFTQPGHLDVGGQYLAPEHIDPKVGDTPQWAAWSLVNRFGIQMFPTHLPKDVPNVYLAGDQTRLEFSGNYPNEGDPQVTKLVEQIEALVTSVKPFIQHPWDHPDAQVLDALSVQDWIAANIGEPAVGELMAVAVRSAFSVEPKDCSVLHFLHYAASCGSFAAFENVNGGGDAIRFRFGTYDLIQRLVGEVGPDNVLFGRRAKLIEQNASSCRVTAQVGEQSVETWTAQRVIVAMAPSASAALTFSPPLPAARTALTDGMPMASTIKGFAIFKTPWWRERFSGYCLSAHGPLDWVMDNTWLDENGQLGEASLMTFIVAEQAVIFGNGQSTPVDRREAVLDQLEVLFDAKDKVRPQLVRYVDWDWSADEWGRGCPAGCIRPRILTKLVNGQRVGAALYAPFQRVHWAGSEAGLKWMGGYMNGAIDSGVRAAEAVAALIT